MIQDALVARITADAGMHALIQDRVYALLAPQGVRSPYLVYTNVATHRESTYCASDLMQQAMYQFDSYSKNYREALLVAKALKLCLLDFEGAMGDTHVASVKLENESELLDPDPGLYRVLTTLIIWHEV